MAKTLTLKFVDGSSKECEVTGRDMGDENVYYAPLSSLKPGIVNFNQNRTIEHHIKVHEVGKDFAVVEVVSWRGHNVGGPYKLYEGIEKGHSYMFGEWSYYFSVSLVMMQQEE